ncbi:acyltransferase family protein [Algirhabdus cladophorae]|uniref:acyltransferase family protein n=1 Tax=Algirhabdus cladophorae TaxID=3377108 RepID=UPI003B847ED0
MNSISASPPSAAAPSSAPRKSTYIHALDGVRAASILLVLMGHALPLGPKDWMMNSVAARSGMALFFCLSGYLIVSILYKKPQVGPFLAKRVMRIVPALFAYLAVLTLFFGLPLKSFVLNMAFLSNYLVDGLAGGPVGHLWSLCVEMHFYIAVSIAVLIAGRRALWLVFPAAFIITGFRIEAEAVANINTHLRVDEILVGGCLALISMHWGDHLRRILRPKPIALATLLVFGTLFALSAHNSSGALVYFRAYFSMAVVGIIMHCQLTRLLRVLEGRIARYIAKISYALYIWHPLMLFGWFNAGTTFERYIFKRPISFVLMWIAAHISTIYWESYWQKAVRRWLGETTPSHPSPSS